MTTRGKPTAARRPVDALRHIERLLGGRITLGALIEAIRLGEGETQLGFAARLGISKSHLCDIEKGRKVVSAERAARFAQTLGYSSEQFVRLALQDVVERAGLAYTVRIEGHPLREGGGRYVASSSSRVVLHVVPDPSGGWAVTRQGASRPLGRHRTKAQALAHARALAKAQAPSEVVTYRRDGVIQGSRAYRANATEKSG